jgi:sulfonate transport system substrate-binding protein
VTDNLWVEAASGEPPAPPPPPVRRSRRWPVLLLAILALAGIYAWVTRGGNAAEANVLNVGSQRGGTKALMLASGVLKGAPYTVEWSEFPAAQTLLEAIGAGAVDVGVAGDAPFQFAYQSGQPIRAIGALASRPRPSGALDILVPAHSAIRDVVGLRGKRIATTRGSIGHYLILRALQANGLKPADVQITFLSPGDAKAAFDSGAIDAWATWSPYVPTALAGGARSIADGAAYYSGYGFDAANARSAISKRALLADFLRREARAYLWAKAHRQAYAQVLAQETGLPAAIALYHVEHQSLARVPIDEALKSEERDVVAQFHKAGALAGSQPLDGAYLPLDQGDSHGS